MDILLPVRNPVVAAHRGVWQGRFDQPWDWRDANADKVETVREQSTGFGLLGSGCNIKGNISADGERIYHMPGQKFYADTKIAKAKGERWFVLRRMHALRVGGKREGSAGYEDVSREKAAMASSDKPRLGTKRRIMYNLLHRPQGATLAELNRATGWDAFSCINDTKAIARDYGGTPHITAVGNRAGSG